MKNMADWGDTEHIERHVGTDKGDESTDITKSKSQRTGKETRRQNKHKLD